MTCGNLRQLAAILKTTATMTMKRFSYLTIALIALTVFPETADAISFRRGKSPEKGSKEYFSGSFSGLFEVAADEGRAEGERIFLKFFAQNEAVLYDESGDHTIYDCYTYSSDGQTVILEGACRIQETYSGYSRLDGIPGKMRLEFVSYGEDPRIAGCYSDNPQRRFEISRSAGHVSIPRSNSQGDLCDIIAFFADDGLERLAGAIPDLWAVSSGYGIDAYGTVAGKSISQYFPYRSLIAGVPDPDGGDFILTGDNDGNNLQVPSEYLIRVESRGQLERILGIDAHAGIPYSDWIGSLEKTAEEIHHEIDSSGHLNGVFAGKKMAAGFIPLLIALVILAVLNMIFGNRPYPGVLHYATSVTLMIVTIFELWYCISLKGDFLWFIFEPETFAHGLACAIGTLAFVFAQLYLILETEINLIIFNRTWSRIPSWVEYILAAIALFAGVHFLLSGKPLLMLCAYGFMLAASLPTIISYVAHSDRTTAMLPFLILCYPMKYFLFVPFIILYVFQASSKYAVSSESHEDPDSKYITDVYGNTRHISRVSPNGPWMDDNGNTYSEGGGSFIRSGQRDEMPFR